MLRLSAFIILNVAFQPSPLSTISYRTVALKTLRARAECNDSSAVQDEDGNVASIMGQNHCSPARHPDCNTSMTFGFYLSQIGALTMAQETSTRSEASLATLLGGIVNDAKDLLLHEFTIAKLEMQQELRKTKSAAMSLGIGAGITVVGTLFLLLMCVHGLVLLIDVPLWGAYGIVGALLVIVGGILLARGKQTVEQIDVIPPKTASTVQETAQWIKEQSTSSRV
jgi:uncharacterized membrane protein